MTEKRKPRWARLDVAWYRAKYSESIAYIAGEVPDERLETFWWEAGARHGHSPNRYFDEIWYRRVNRDVEDGIRAGTFASGFHHYEEIGFKERSGHWLFDEGAYFDLNRDFTPAMLEKRGFVNGYDHYLAVGQREMRVSSPYFDPDFFRLSLFENRMAYDSPEGEFSRFLTDDGAVMLRCSWYFDPKWYMHRYPEVADTIASREFASPLHHYLSNATPLAFDPNPWFSEEFYLSNNPDVEMLVRAAGSRNGFEHYLKFGIAENRPPRADIDLSVFQHNGRRENAFVQFIISQENGSIFDCASDITAEQQMCLNAAKGHVLLAHVSRTPLDFDYIGSPILSVLIFFQRDLATLIQTLAALHERNRMSIQIVIVDESASDALLNLSRMVRGIRVIPMQEEKISKVRARALELLDAHLTLVLEPGVAPYPGALEAAISTCVQKEAVALAPQIIGPDTRVIEAGVSVGRDGRLDIHGTGDEAFAPTVAFERPCDTICGGAVICLTSVIKTTIFPEAFSDRALYWAALGLAIRRAAAGKSMRYEPTFLVGGDVLHRAAEPTEALELARLRREYAELLRYQPIHQQMARSEAIRSERGGGRVLFVSEDVPLIGDGGNAARWVHAIRHLVKLGARVTVLALSHAERSTPLALGDLDATVEVIIPTNGGAFEDILAQRTSSFDTIWVGGLATFKRVHSSLIHRAEKWPSAGYILDARGDMPYLDAMLLEKDDPNGATVLDDAQWFFQVILAEDKREAKFLRNLGFSHIEVLNDHVRRQRGASYQMRKGLLFAAPLKTQNSREFEGLSWFVRDVLPRLHSRLPKEASILIAGFIGEGIDLRPLTFSAGVEPVPNRRPEMDSCFAHRRILIEPFSVLGAPTIESRMALACGLPVVAGGVREAEGFLTPPLEAEPFAAAVTSLYENAVAWWSLSDHATHDEDGGVAYYDQLSKIMHLANGDTSSEGAQYGRRGAGAVGS